MTGVNTGGQERQKYFRMTPLRALRLCEIPVARIKQNELCAFFGSLLDSSGGIAVVPALLVAHVLGLVFWVGGLLVTSMALTRHTQEASAEARQALARLERIYLRGLADPGALLTLLAGIGLITTNSSYYLHAPWLHIKLTFVLILIGLHGIVAVRTKRFAAGRISLKRSEARLLVVATLLVFLSILIATLVGQVYLT
jgi:protoporphyrinogen IX oxidase